MKTKITVYLIIFMALIMATYAYTLFANYGKFDKMLDITFLILFFIIVLISFLLKSKIIRYITLGFSLVYFGFLKKNYISIIELDFYNLLKNSWPITIDNLFWYLFWLFVIVTAVLLGRVYCGWICPFGACQEFLKKINPLEFKMKKEIHQKLRYLKFLILIITAVLFYVLSINIINYVEPFDTLFYFYIGGILLTILIIILLISSFNERFYCKYLCPYGAIFVVLSYFNLYRIERWDECSFCKKCEFLCFVNNIDGNKINNAECLRCQDCERLSVNEKGCTHYLLKAKNIFSETEKKKSSQL